MVVYNALDFDKSMVSSCTIHGADEESLSLSFFFVPVIASVINYVDVIAENAVALLVISLVTTVLTFGVTAWVVQLTRRALNRRKGETE